MLVPIFVWTYQFWHRLCKVYHYVFNSTVMQWHCPLSPIPALQVLLLRDSLPFPPSSPTVLKP